MARPVIPYLDVCSGYSAFTVGAEGLGFECAGYAEIEAFPCALLGHHYGASAPRYLPDPEIMTGKDRKKMAALVKSTRSLGPAHFGNRLPNFGDFTQIREDDLGPVQLLTGGTPCQAFSVAGKRLGLDDARGNLTLEFLALAKRLRIPWLAWENVPGFLSHDKGRTMGTFLRLLGELGYGWAYRVLDVQYIRVDRYERAVPQRRRRVFVVAHLGDAAGPAAVLFDRESLRGDSAPRRETGQGATHAVAPSLVSSGRGVERTGETRGQDPVVGVTVAGTLEASASATRGAGTSPAVCIPVAFGGGNTSGAIELATAQTAHGNRLDFDSETFIAQPIAASQTRGAESSGKGGYAGRRQEDDINLVAHSLRAEGFDASEDGSGSGRGTPIVPVAFDLRNGTQDVTTMALQAGGMGDERGICPNAIPHTLDQWAVRRLIPVECERLMGVPDDFTNILFRGKPAADGPRYKALGNSQGANNMRWIAHGIRDVMRAQGDA
jgi:DNA (cytosine-5)-methyltransferase 1